MTNSNSFTEHYLVREILTRLSRLGYRNDIHVSSPEVLKTLKERLVTGPVDIAITDTNRFKAVISARDYNEAVCKRHYFGVRRIRRLCRSAERLAGAKWATAWTLTTCYYAAYFAALELMELTGRHVMYLSTAEASQITSCAKVGMHTASAGPYLAVAQLESNGDEVEIIFNQSAQKPHDFAWKQLEELIRGTASGTADALRHQVSLLRFLGWGSATSWSRPNEVRNLWNYTDATLFCERGEGLGEKMMEFVVSPKGAIKWGIGKHVHPSEQNHASSIAYIRASLLGAVDRVTDVVLPESLGTRIAA